MTYAVRWDRDAGEVLTLSAYDLALDLWGWPPRPSCVCPACGLRAEPYLDGCCWLCCHTGQRDRVRNAMPAHYWDRLTTEG
jgi:hypothetical protein